MEVVKSVEGQAGTTEAEVGRMDIGTLRTLQGGKAQSWEELVVGVRNTHSGLGSIHERCEEATARIVGAA